MRRFVLVVTQTAVGSGVLCAQVSLSSFPSGTYHQDFNTLATSGTVAWNDNVTVAGWYAARTVDGGSYSANSGTSANGAIYSYGTGILTERALGSLASIGTGTIGYGLRLLNDSNISYTQISVAYTGEQWRRANAAAHRLEFGYKLGSGLTDPLASGFTAVPLLDFVSPQLGSALPLDGNAAANQTQIPLIVVLNQSFDPGEELMLRWIDFDDGGTDHGLAIDDLSVAVPEASTWTVVPLTAFGLGLACWRAKRRRN